MGQAFGRTIKSFVPSLSDRAAQMNGIPVDDDCGEQVEAADSVLAFFGAQHARDLGISKNTVADARAEDDLAAPIDSTSSRGNVLAEEPIVLYKRIMGMILPKNG